MTTVPISGWKEGFQKVKFTQLLQSKVGYSLSQAKGVTDAVVARRTVELPVSDSAVEPLLLAMTELGAECAAAVHAG